MSNESESSIEVCYSIVGRAYQQGGALTVDDALEDPGLGTQRSVKEIRPRSVMVAPMYVRGGRLGCIYAECRSRRGAFRDSQRESLVRLASVASVYVDALLAREDGDRAVRELADLRAAVARDAPLRDVG